MLRGTVREDGTVLLESIDPAIQVGDDNVSGAIYGNQNVTAKRLDSAFSHGQQRRDEDVDVQARRAQPAQLPRGKRRWARRRRTIPSACSCSSRVRHGHRHAGAMHGCGTISILNTQGIANFTAPNQPYYWYHDRLAAKGQAGDSTTQQSDVEVHRLAQHQELQLLRDSECAVAARHCRRSDTTWSVFYNPTRRLAPGCQRLAALEAIGRQLSGGARYTSGSSSSGARR